MLVNDPCHIQTPYCNTTYTHIICIGPFLKRIQVKINNPYGRTYSGRLLLRILIPRGLLMVLTFVIPSHVYLLSALWLQTVTDILDDVHLSHILVHSVM